MKHGPNPPRARWSRLLPSIVALCLVAACAGTAPNPRALQTLKLAQVDLPKYMGRWYVIADIPEAAERGVVAAQVEWRLRDDGRIDAKSIARDGGFDAPETRRTLVATVEPGTTNAQWRIRRMRFFLWPVSTDRLTLYVDAMYQTTIVVQLDRRRGAILARTPYITEAKYQDLLGRLEGQGFDVALVRRMPQQREQVGRPGFRSPRDPT